MVDAAPAYLQPFVLETEATEATEPVQVGAAQLYLPPGRSSPVVVLVHGGPMRTPPVRPASEWPVFQGYANALAARGVGAVVFDHGLLTGDEEAAPEHLRTTIEIARAHDGVDGSRVVLWHFSGGGVLATPYLSAPPPWLRGLAFSYPVLDDEDPGWDPRAGLHRGLRLPLLITRVAHESPCLVEGQAQFVAIARDLDVPLEVIDVPDAPHAFDCQEPTPERTAAVTRAMEWVVTTLT